MVKKNENNYPYKSRFGSHSTMVVRQEGEKSVCLDEFGEYTTESWRVDCGLADPNRCSQKRLGKLFSGKKE